jgi:hypothetical protein
LDYKVSIGYDFAQTEDEQERKRMEDTFRVISLSFSNLGGASSVVDYFSQHGKRSYEDSVYSNLGEFYFDKRRYNDAAATYNAFVVAIVADVLTLHGLLGSMLLRLSRHSIRKEFAVTANNILSIQAEYCPGNPGPRK